MRRTVSLFHTCHHVFFFCCYLQLILSLTNFHWLPGLIEVESISTGMLFSKAPPCHLRQKPVGLRRVFSLKALCTEDWESIFRNFRPWKKHPTWATLRKPHPPKIGTVTSLYMSLLVFNVLIPYLSGLTVLAKAFEIHQFPTQPIHFYRGFGSYRGPKSPLLTFAISGSFDFCFQIHNVFCIFLSPGSSRKTLTENG